MFCNKCGKQLPDGSTQCKYCGNSFSFVVGEDKNENTIEKLNESEYEYESEPAKVASQTINPHQINFDDDWEKVTGRRFEVETNQDQDENKTTSNKGSIFFQGFRERHKKKAEGQLSDSFPEGQAVPMENTVVTTFAGDRGIIDRVRLFYSFIGTFIFYMAANAFECFNFMPRYDALNYIDHFADSWEVRLGRFLQPLYGSIRGDFQLPWVVGMLTMVYITIAVYLLTDMLNIKNKWYIMLTGGFLAANLTITDLNASFTFLVDAFMFSMLMAVLGVYIINKKARLVNMLLGTLCFFIAMGMYQAFACVILVTVILIMIRDLLTEKVNLKMFLHWVCYGISLLLGAIWYYFFYQEEMFRLSVEATEGYNGLGNLSEKLGSGISGVADMVGKNYLVFLKFFFGYNEEVAFVSVICNYILLLILILTLVRLICKKKPGALNVIFVVMLILLLPLAMLVISIGMGNTSIMYRVCYSIFFLYIFILAVSSWEGGENKEGSGKKGRLNFYIQLASIICGLIILGNNIRFSNEVYVLQKIMYDRALSYVTRIADDVTAVDGYDRQSMRVVVVGNINSRTTFNYELIEKHTNITGFDNTSVSYFQTVTSYLSFLRNQITVEEDWDVINRYKDMPEVQEMPVYPKDGYCRLIGDRVVVKLPE